MGAQVGRRAAVGKPARFLQPVHERRHRVDVEAGGVEALEPDAVGLVFVLARVIDLRLDRERLRRRDRCVRRLACRRGIGARCRDRHGERRQHVQERSLLARDRARHVPLRDVRDFVCEHRRELGFGLREKDEAGVHSDVPARQRKGVDGGIGHGKELEILPPLGDRGNEPVAELVQIVVDFGILEVGARRPDLPDDRFTDLAFLRRGERRLGFLAEIGQRLGQGFADGKHRRRHRLRGKCDRREHSGDRHAHAAARPGPVRDRQRRHEFQRSGSDRIRC